MLSEIPFFGTAKNSISLNRLKPINKQKVASNPLIIRVCKHLNLMPQTGIEPFFLISNTDRKGLWRLHHGCGVQKVFKRLLHTNRNLSFHNHIKKFCKIIWYDIYIIFIVRLIKIIWIIVIINTIIISITNHNNKSIL